MREIVQNEFSATQYRIFKFESDLLIDELFVPDGSDKENSRGQLKGKAFGLTELEEAAKLSVEVVNMLIACFTFYKAWAHDKAGKKADEEKQTIDLLEEKKKRLGMLNEIEVELERQNMPKDITDRITNKYKDQLIALAEEL